MSKKENHLNLIEGENFYHYLKKEFSTKSYHKNYDYIKKVCSELNDEQPFYILDLADILWKIQLWKEKFPQITPFYAVKANADPVLIRFLVLLGLSFDCSTKGEIDLVLKSGGSPKNIIYAHTIKPLSSLKYASKVGVDFITFDSIEELDKIHKHFPSAKLLLRIKPENPHCSFDLSIKYGCPVPDAEALLKHAKNSNLNIIGVSFHVGALCEDPSSFSKSIENCRTIFDLAQDVGFHFTVLDLGAGFFGSTSKEEFFNKIESEINMALKLYFPDDETEIIAEPGCYMVGSAQRTVNSVIGKKLINGNSADDIQVHYYLNDGFYGSFFKQFEVYDIYARPLLKTEELEKRANLKSKIWGQTCCAEDVVVEKCLFPELEVGEYVVWENMGAYTLNLCCTFTSVPIPIGKYVFIKNPRLNLSWVKNTEEIANFIAEKAVLVDSEEY